MSCNVVLSYHIWLFLILFVEQIRVRARVEHDEDELCVVLLPDEQPVGLDVALPLSLSVARQYVGAVFLFESFSVQQLADHRPKLVHWQPTPFTAFQVLLAFASDA